MAFLKAVFAMLILGIRNNQLIRLELPDGSQGTIRVIKTKIVLDLPDSIKVSREKILSVPKECLEDVL